MKKYFFAIVALIAFFSSCISSSKSYFSHLPGSEWGAMIEDSSVGTFIKFYEGNKADLISISSMNGQPLRSITHLIYKSKNGRIYMYLGDNGNDVIDKKAFPISAIIKDDVLTFTFKKDKDAIFEIRRQPVK